MFTNKTTVKYFEKSLEWILIGIVLFAALRVAFLARDLSFHEDEYQHTHLAWNALTGKIIYRDFQDSHGPLSNLWYRQILKFLTPDGDLAQSFYRIRYLNLIVVFLTASLVGLNIFLLSRSRLALFLGMSIYLSGSMVASVAFRIRPDCYVAFFSVLSLYLWQKRKYFGMGLCLGLSLGFHGKFLPINIFILLGATFLLWKQRRFLYQIVTGEIIVLFAILGWFWYHRALSFAFRGMMSSGFETAFKRMVLNRDFNRLFRSISKTEFWILFLIGIAIGILLIYFFSSKKISLDHSWGMATFYSIAGLLFLFAPVWAHAFVFIAPIIIPLFVAALFLVPSLHLGVAIVSLVGVLFLYFQDPRESDRGKEMLDLQLDSLKKALVETRRTDPIFYIWTSRCPAYVFNADPRPNWTESFFRANRDLPIRQLPPINYLSIHPLFIPGLDPEERDYIQKHFKPDGCFWKRIK